MHDHVIYFALPTLQVIATYTVQKSDGLRESSQTKLRRPKPGYAITWENVSWNSAALSHKTRLLQLLTLTCFPVSHSSLLRSVHKNG